MRLVFKWTRDSGPFIPDPSAARIGIHSQRRFTFPLIVQRGP